MNSIPNIQKTMSNCCKILKSRNAERVTISEFPYRITFAISRSMENRPKTVLKTMQRDQVPL